MSSKTAVCFVHGGDQMYTTLMHLHHIKMRSRGGSDEKSNLVFLCPTCHNAIHVIADKIRAGKPNSHLYQQWRTPQSLERSRQLVLEAVQENSVDMTGMPRKLTLVIPFEVMQKLSILAKQTSRKGSSRESSVTSVATSLLINAVNSRT